MVPRPFAGAKYVQRMLEFIGQGRGKAHKLAGARVRQAQFARVQGLPRPCMPAQFPHAIQDALNRG